MSTSLHDDQIRATIAKLNAETMRIQANAKWYPFVVLAGVLGIALGIFEGTHGWVTTPQRLA